MQYSIIICTYNRATFLKETIDSILLHLTDQTKYELLIVDNNSTDTTAEVVKQYLHVPIIRYVFEQNQGLSYARNRGIKEARYPIIVFVDDDIDIDPNYLSVLDKLYSDPSVQIVGGKVLPYKSRVPEWLPKKYYYLASVYDMGDTPAFVPKLMGANHTFRKEVADKVGDYNVNIGPLGDFKLGGDENDFLLRAQNKGYRLLYHPDLIVHHKIQNRFNREFILKYSYNIGATEANIDYTNRKHLLALKCMKYVVDRLAAGIGLAPNGSTEIVKEIRKQHKQGYLDFVRNTVGK
ncbi:glycosyltransferase family 2 protein [Telluribacter sp. SYSU D00476]|uniref:glycosyltransferase family 2 protein n=1 Tax=Telluribacter sp. SYSU D00476 TaxID=2811430 RepID=UPI001FF2BD2B|nr:glycosyltransferase [Telluribacter sp. SYSU D00476]